LAKGARFTTGRRTRSEVLGEAYVARSDSKRSAFNADFLDFITEGAWGSVWSRPGLTKRERSLITLALLAALGHHEEVAMHVRATANTGATPEDIKEALLHVAVYAGVPAANQAFKIAEQTLEAMAEEEKAQEGRS
jgi:4-carboxymuconolactone decarboxylase